MVIFFRHINVVGLAIVTLLLLHYNGVMHDDSISLYLLTHRCGTKACRRKTWVFSMRKLKRLLLFIIIAVLTGIGNIVIKLVPFKTLIRIMTNVDEVVAGPLSKQQAYRLKLVALTLRRVHRHVFWRVKCYEQALVALFFARFLGINMMIYFGLTKDEDGKLLAHTWTEAGDMYITGGDNAHAFSVVYKRGYRVNRNRIGYSLGDTRVKGT